MNTLMVEITFGEPGKQTAAQVQSYLQQHRQDPALIPALNMDLTFISPHARSLNDFAISRVEHLRDNTYVLYYKINYFIFNLCQDMNIEDVYDTSITFDIQDSCLAFNVINNDRDTVDEF